MHQQVIVELPYALVRPVDQWLHIVARLAPGVAATEASSVVQVVYHRWLGEWAGPGATAEELKQLAQWRLELVPGGSGYLAQREALAQPLTIFAAVVTLVLLITCANLASLLLARAVARQRELAVRLAIGAGTRRLTRQLLTESLLLAGLGAGLGVLMALWGARALAATMAAGPVQMFFGRSSWIAFDAHVDARALAVTAGVGLLSGVLLGLAPALLGPRLALAPALATREAAPGAGAGRSRLGRVLVMAQVALSLVVLIAAGLLVRTLHNLRSEALGFDRRSVLMVWTQPSATARDPLQLRALWHSVQRRLAALPGVESAGAANQGLLDGFLPRSAQSSTPMLVDGEAPRPTTHSMFRTFVTPGYFRTVGIPMLAGRDFTEADTDSAPPVVIINQSMALFYFDNRNPIGRRIRLGTSDSLAMEIVGVVGDVVTGTPRGAGGKTLLEVTYENFSDDGAWVIDGFERAANAAGDRTKWVTK